MTTPAILQSPWRGYLIGLVIILCLAALPWVPSLSAKAFADAHGCALHEGFVNACVVDGVDRGKELYDQFVGLWFATLSVPIDLVALFIWFRLLGEEREKRAKWTSR